MMQTLYCGASSACIEIVNRVPYHTPEPYTVFLNDQLHGMTNANVFSLFSLQPDTDYTVTVRGETTGVTDSVSFRTKAERFAVNVRAFGATGDGVSDDTEAIRTAIHVLPKGGRLIFPKGVYRTRPVLLKSYMTLELCEGATLLGESDKTKYPVLPAVVNDAVSGEEHITGVFEGVPKPMYQALLSAQDAEQITVVGPGTVDGNAQNSTFWTTYREDPVARPRLISFLHCRDIVFHGFTACNSPSWNFHPFHCENVSILDVRVQAPKDSPNTDAIDPEACDHVQIIGCRLSVGDDCIAIKSGKIELSRKYAWPADHHTIRNCLMEFGHGAITLGSESAMGIKNLSVSQCRFVATDRGLRIKTRRGRGKDCDITGVTFDNIRMERVLTPIVINMWYNCCDPDRESEYVWSRESLPVDDRTPHLGTFRFTNMDCTDAEAAACYIDALPEMPIDEVTFENIRVSFRPDAKPHIPAMQNFAEERLRLGLYFDNVRRVHLQNVRLLGADGDAVIANHCGMVDGEARTEE